MFRFSDAVRPHIMALGELLYYANSRSDGRWASQSSLPSQNGVYGHAASTVRAILCEEVGEAVANAAIELINYGGNRSIGEDIEDAVQEAINRMTEEVIDRSR